MSNGGSKMTSTSKSGKGAHRHVSEGFCSIDGTDDRRSVLLDERRWTANFGRDVLEIASDRADFADLKIIFSLSGGERGETQVTTVEPNPWTRLYALGQATPLGTNSMAGNGGIGI